MIPAGELPQIVDTHMRGSPSRVFLFGFRSRWSLHPSVLKCSGSAKPPLRNSSVLGTSEFTAHKRRWPEGRFGISMEQHSVSLLTPASLLLLPKSQPLRWVVIWDRRSAAFFDFAEISVLTVICIKITTPFGVVIFMHTVRTSHTRRK